MEKEGSIKRIKREGEMKEGCCSGVGVGWCYGEEKKRGRRGRGEMEKIVLRRERESLSVYVSF